MKKNRLRIHQKTLRLMNRPEYVYIWVNPDEKELAICCADKGSKDAIKVKKAKECEIYSRFLFSKLKRTAPNLEHDKTYVFEGVLSKGNKVARFSIADNEVFRGRDRSYEKI